MKWLEGFLEWRAYRREVRHARWLKKNRVHYVSKAPDPGCVVHNMPTTSGRGRALKH